MSSPLRPAPPPNKRLPLPVRTAPPIVSRPCSHPHKLINISEMSDASAVHKPHRSTPVRQPVVMSADHKDQSI